MFPFGYNVNLKQTPAELRALGDALLGTGEFVALEPTYYEHMYGVETGAYTAALRDVTQAYAPRVIVHFPGFNLSEESLPLRDAMVDEFRYACAYTRMLGGREIVVHAGRSHGSLHVPRVMPDGRRAAPEIHQARVWMLCVDAFRTFTQIAQTFDMCIHTENLSLEHITVRCADLHRLIDDVGAPNLDIVLDVGHCHHTGGDVAAETRAAGSRLHHLHLHDNFGQKDEHLPIGEGSIDFHAFARAMREIPYDGVYMLELMQSLPGMMRASRERLLACLTEA